LVLLVGVIFYAISEYKIRRTFNIPAEAISVPTDAESIANGKRLTVMRGCVDCHGENMGGKLFISDPMLGTIYGANLTSGKGGAGDFADADFVRAIRHGVGPDGKALWIMPAFEYNGLSAQDIGDIIAYLRSVPPVDYVPGENTAGPLGRFGVVTGAIPVFSVDLIDHSIPMKAEVQAGPTVEYGAYLAASCHGCHGPNLSGGAIPGSAPDAPKAANLTPGGDMQGWQEADFVRAIREGVRPDGTQINPLMPWKYLGQTYTEDELKALWLYLQSLPPSTTASQ
jgi:mono/diheme cytochrome c family protein